MLTVPKKYFDNLPSGCKRLFIEAWYSLVHEESLDSYRVRCMNSINILKELQYLITDPNFKHHEEYIKFSAEEGKDILEKDTTIKSHFGKKYERIKNLIDKINDMYGKKKGEVESFINMNREETVLLTSYYFTDFIDELESRYQGIVVSEIENAIKLEKKEDIVLYVSNLLTYLFDKGYSLNSLYALIWEYFIKSSSGESFEQKFKEFKKILIRKLSNYHITLTITAKTKNLKDLEIDKNIEIKIISDTKAEIKVKNIEAVDDRSAGLEAKRKLYRILDIIRFEVETKAVWIERLFSSQRPDDSKKDFRFRDIIPNPIKSIGSEEVESFNKKIVSIFGRKNFDEESKKKIKSALRFYRIGRDGEVLENKFLNWWTALEYMTVMSEGDNKIKQVEKRIVSTLVVEYVKTHLYHLRESLSYCKIAPSEASIKKYGKEAYSDIKDIELFDIIGDQNNEADMKNKTDKYPMLQYRLKQFRKNINDKNFYNFLNNHEKHVKWHINRIYRIRNAIVHNANASINLSLIVSNLEYYLKRLISLSINVIYKNESIKSLQELFAHIVYTHNILIPGRNRNDKNQAVEDWTTIKEIIEKTVI